jgi:hypothetical protein
MSQTLQEFLDGVKERLVLFEEYWVKNNIKYPDNFPMEMKTGLEGLWWEFMKVFDTSDSNFIFGNGGENKWLIYQRK